MDTLKPFHFTVEGTTYYVRPIDPSDKKLLQTGFTQLSEWSKYFRFFAVHNKLSDNELKFFTEVDGINHVAWGIGIETGNDPIPVGVGRFVRLKDDQDTAEVAFTVVDSYQKQGVGRILISVLNIAASHVGIKKFRYYVLKENQFVMNTLNQLGILKTQSEGPIQIIDTNIYENHLALPNVPETKNLIATMTKVENLIHGK